MADHSYFLDIRGLNSYYGERQVLFDIRLTIPHHKVTVIMGPSGCGKSTFLRHLIGLSPVSPQQIFWEERDLAHLTKEEMNLYRRRMGVLFQGGALFNSMTVADNIAVPLKVHTRLPQETIRVMAQIKLHQVGLTNFSNYMPSQLSGGMQKRAGLARSLAMDPEFLFVDEPSSGLDPITAAGMDELILELRESLGMTIIAVTHELESAFHIADQMVVMDQGRVLASGTPQEIQNSPNERVKQFLNRKAEQKRMDMETYVNSLMSRHP